MAFIVKKYHMHNFCYSAKYLMQWNDFTKWWFKWDFNFWNHSNSDLNNEPRQDLRSNFQTVGRACMNECEAGLACLLVFPQQLRPGDSFSPDVSWTIFVCSCVLLYEPFLREGSRFPPQSSSGSIRTQDSPCLCQTGINLEKQPFHLRLSHPVSVLWHVDLC